MTNGTDLKDKHDKTLEVVVRTPAGHPHAFSFKRNTRVDKAAREAERYFVAEGQLEAGDYGLALIRDGQSIELADGARLDDYDIIDGDVLALYPKKPQVDGQLAMAA
jgi:hypothetical protein